MKKNGRFQTLPVVWLNATKDHFLRHPKDLHFRGEEYSSARLAVSLARLSFLTFIETIFI